MGHLNFTIPAAIESCDKVFFELDFHSDRKTMQETLLAHMVTAISYWEERSRKLQSKVSVGNLISLGLALTKCSFRILTLIHLLWQINVLP